MSQTLILISCSNQKEKGGKPEYAYNDSILPVLNENTKLRLLNKRLEIFKLIQDGKIVDKVRAGGNRKYSPNNLKLQIGPDLAFGHKENHKINTLYKPAYKRYDGRFYANAEVDAFEKAIYHENHTLIVSGLYGLITLNEPIQAYSCHLDDVCMSVSEGDSELPSDQVKARISDLWKDQDSRVTLFYESLFQYINHHNTHSNHQINEIIDLLSEYSYQRVFQWEKLSAKLMKMGIKIFHREVSGKKEPEFLPDLGSYYKKIIGIKDRKGPPPETELISFTDELQPDKYIEKKLKNEMTNTVWDKLKQHSREELVQGERLFELYVARSTGDHNEIADRNMHYFIALEIELQRIFGTITNKDGMRVEGNIGNYFYHLEKGELADKHIHNKENFLKDLGETRILRNKTSHPKGNGITKGELAKARHLTISEKGHLAKLIEIKASKQC